MRLPRKKQINQAYRALVQELKVSLKEVNQRASTLMAKGNYSGAKSALAQAETITAYVGEVKSLQKRLGTLASAGNGRPKKGDSHKLWEFYIPVLRTIADLGGEARRPEIDTKFEETFREWLKPGDNSTSAKGRPRWKTMIGRTRNPMIAEGYIEMQTRGVWQITSNGRAAARKKLAER